VSLPPAGAVIGLAAQGNYDRLLYVFIAEVSL
jgi:hypothetical protein